MCDDVLDIHRQSFYLFLELSRHIRLGCVFLRESVESSRILLKEVIA